MNYEETKEQALTFLEYRSLSEWELRQKLLRKGAENSVIDEVMEFLREYKLVNDTDYARRFASDLVKIKKYGAYRVKREMQNKGIDEYIIEQVMDDMELDERQALLPLVEKKLGGSSDKKDIDRTIRYFIYRGYSFDDIKSCIREILNN